eukprot:15250847-Alexandrium_andersonii.AAC.1
MHHTAILAQAIVAQGSSGRWYLASSGVGCSFGKASLNPLGNVSRRHSFATGALGPLLALCSCPLAHGSFGGSGAC